MPLSMPYIKTSFWPWQWLNTIMGIVLLSFGLRRDRRLAFCQHVRSLPISLSNGTVITVCIGIDRHHDCGRSHFTTLQVSLQVLQAGIQEPERHKSKRITKKRWHAATVTTNKPHTFKSHTRRFETKSKSKTFYHKNIRFITYEPSCFDYWMCSIELEIDDTIQYESPNHQLFLQAKTYVTARRLSTLWFLGSLLLFSPQITVQPHCLTRYCFSYSNGIPRGEERWLWPYHTIYYIINQASAYAAYA